MEEQVAIVRQPVYNTVYNTASLQWSLQYSVLSVILSNTQHSQEYSVMISILTANNKAGSMLPPTFMLDFHHKAEHNQEYKSLSFLYSHWGQLKT